MKDELEKKLVKDFPQLFQDVGKRKSGMHHGCCIGDGWHDILRDLCEKIMATIPPPETKFSQIKEKFGGLVAYMDGASDEVSQLASDAEAAAWEVCDRCGSKEEVTTDGRFWLRTLCSTHAAEQGQRDVEREKEDKERYKRWVAEREKSKSEEK